MTIKPHLIEFSKIGNPLIGYISVAEINKNISFKVKRVYWTFLTPKNIIRGNHAHKTLKQVIIAVSGKIVLTLIDKNKKKQIFVLDKPNIGLYIPNNYWREIEYEPNTVQLCLASEVYDENDYIRDFQEFIN